MLKKCLNTLEFALTWKWGKTKTKSSKGNSIRNSWLPIDYIKMLDP
jgi:hypothetical protein